MFAVTLHSTNHFIVSFESFLNFLQTLVFIASFDLSNFSLPVYYIIIVNNNLYGVFSLLCFYAIYYLNNLYNYSILVFFPQLHCLPSTARIA